VACGGGLSGVRALRAGGTAIIGSASGGKKTGRLEIMWTDASGDPRSGPLGPICQLLHIYPFKVVVAVCAAGTEGFYSGIERPTGRLATIRMDANCDPRSGTQGRLCRLLHLHLYGILVAVWAADSGGVESGIPGL